MRIDGIWEMIVTVTSPWFPGRVNPLEARLLTFASSPLAWPVVSAPSAAVYSQVISISPVSSALSISGSAPGPMKTEPIQ